MADVRHRTTAGNWFRYLLRFVGLLALIVAAFGLIFYYSTHDQPRDFAAVKDSTNAAITDGGIDGVMLLLGLAGAAIAIVWLVVEAIMGVTLVTGRRAAVSGNVYAQVALAAGLFLVVNGLAFKHYARYDCTRGSQFTLNDDLVKELQTLSSDSPTDVVVLQLHKSAVSRGQEPDNIDKAAELKVVEKVNDLVDELRELGPRFRVTVLDRQDEYYADKVDKLPIELRKALVNAPEDSIFFHANNRVRRMSFADFYRIDKSASRKSENVATPDGKTETRVRTTNLVLLPQGRDEFVKRLLTLEQRKPRIGLVTIHPELSTRENREEYSSAGLRKSLEANGFEVSDILVKKWGGRGGPVPAALTPEEYDLDRFENRTNLISQSIQNYERQLQSITEAEKRARTQPLTELDRLYSRLIRRPITTEADRQIFLEVLAANIALLNREIDEAKPALAEAETKYRELQKNEKAGEGRRATDIAAKLRQTIADCDLLVIPRLTSMNLAKREVISSDFYTMPKEQADVFKEFLKEGKPILACLGPVKFGAPRDPAEADDLEKLFTRLGIEFGNQAILTDEEARAAAERQGEGFGGANELPPLVLDFKSVEGKKANPIREAFSVSARAVEGKLGLKQSGPRSVSSSPAKAASAPFAATILQTVKESWNEEKPIPDDEYVPKFEPAKYDDPKKGTPEEEHRGPFAIGVALETKVPAEWFDDKLAAAQSASTIGAAAGGLGLGASTILLDADAFAAPGSLPNRPTVRIVAFGHGGLFTGKELSPAQEQLLLHTVNWQLRRDELLPRDVEIEKRWQFPRVEMSEQQKKLWHMGTFLGLPMLCAFTGVVVLMTRRMR